MIRPDASTATIRSDRCQYEVSPHPYLFRNDDPTVFLHYNHTIRLQVVPHKYHAINTYKVNPIYKIFISIYYLLHSITCRVAQLDPARLFEKPIQFLLPDAKDNVSKKSIATKCSKKSEESCRQQKNERCRQEFPQTSF